MPEARGDIREIVGQPVFVPLQKLAMIYGKVFRLSFGPKSFVVVSDAAVARHIMMTNAANYSKGILSEILDFVMGSGLIPADGEVWKARRRVVVPSLHRKYIANMAGRAVEMENFFSRLTLDIIGKAVFNYDFDSLTHDDPVIQAVYTVLREAEYRSTYPLPYWQLPLMMWLVPRQRQCVEALRIINTTLDSLIAKSKRLFDEEDQEFGEDYLSDKDPSILHFLLASGDEITSKQLRDDLMTMLIAGHETTAAVLTWTLFCLTDRPDVLRRMQQEVNEAMRLYPQPPVLIRRALEDDVLGGFHVSAGSDIFISVWNIHRDTGYWTRPEDFDPDRFSLEGPVPNETTENFNYLPFGGGRRKCIGDQFALFESLSALAVLLRRFEFRMAPGAPPVNMTTGATIHTSEGLLMQVVPRTITDPLEGCSAFVRCLKS
ncbi:cytochrome P450 [Coccomyxa subellipsoidea C-169]|uniref:Cytochrome P450 n=1 Tax=Coccomyxa subellipsoidea (strain C-169) TaxID=574566 RepID=I0ZAZ1_COCSC|nr:cytochrome P450 [Coccomyxa subellipsoidea C-169]EIE27810.1 cytochrome P450 [Coccomyxa subellipsoidea C-169]|eukprot:XP_005652354.1 cytochrome P450 [Coccomyxa subellipsoidea C-169]